MENSIYKMYDLVFEDIVQNYIECLNEDAEDNKEKLTLTESEKKKVAHKLIYNNDYLWETIHEIVDYEIGRIINNRKEEE